MAFMLGNHLNFTDSFQFMSSSLDKLVSNLPKEDLKYTSEEFTGKKFSLMSQQGVYPYDYMDCFETRPVHEGMCILDLSKTLMYDFHYNYIKNKHDDTAKLLFTDTDSLTYEIEAEDVYWDFWYDKDKFNNSDYPENSPYHDKTNKKVIGKFKDEAVSIPIVEFVGLKSKMYS